MTSPKFRHFSPKFFLPITTFLKSSNYRGKLCQGTAENSSNYRKFELWGSNYGGLFIRRPIGILKGPKKSVRIIESSNYGGSNYGGSTVSVNLVILGDYKVIYGYFVATYRDLG